MKLAGMGVDASMSSCRRGRLGMGGVPLGSATLVWQSLRGSADVGTDGYGV